jgi:hypothetical protein
MFLWACLPIILSSVLGKENNIMYCILKSQINGKPFLVLPADNERDISRIKEYMQEMKLSAELFLEEPSDIKSLWSGSEIHSHIK